MLGSWLPDAMIGFPFAKIGEACYNDTLRTSTVGSAWNVSAHQTRYPRTKEAEVDMGAKIVLTGQARDIQKSDQAISFTIVTGPATGRPPR